MRTVRIGAAIGLTGQLALLAVLAATVGLGPVGWLVGLASGLIGNATLAYGRVVTGIVALGPANRVTLIRATLVAGVSALVADSFVRSVPVATVAGLAGVALVLDAVDGLIARLTDTASLLGARFDMEVDAFLIFVLSVYVARSVGPWVLAIGAARYALLVAGWLLPWLREAVPKRYWRKTVAAIQGIVLTVAVAGILPVAELDIVLVLALLLLAESFGRDVVWLQRYRPIQTPQTHRTVELSRMAVATGPRPPRTGTG